MRVFVYVAISGEGDLLGVMVFVIVYCNVRERVSMIERLSVSSAVRERVTWVTRVLDCD